MLNRILRKTPTQLVGAALLVLILFGTASSAAAQYAFDAQTPLVIGDQADPFRYDGTNVRPIDGIGAVDVDAVSNTGKLRVDVYTSEESGPLTVGDGIELEGWIRIVMDRFEGPMPFMSGGIAEAALVHGDTGLMSELMPEIYSDVLGWGWIDIYVDGQLVYEDLAGHFMVTERVRRGEEMAYQIYRESDGVIYSPALEDKTGFAFSEEREIHLWMGREVGGLVSTVAEDLFLHLNLVISPESISFGSQAPPPDPEDPEDPGGGGGGSNGGPKGNNGIGNGLDPQPPGDPKENDTEDGGNGKGKKK